MPALPLTKKECNYIMAPVLEASLTKTSVARTFPQAVVYGPRQSGGLDYWNLYIFQGLAAILVFQENIAANNKTGNFYNAV